MSSSSTTRSSGAAETSRGRSGPAPVSGTVRLHRVLKAPAERVYKAFLDPRALVKWLPPHGYVAEVHSMDARVGGGYRMSFANLTTGQAHAFGGKYTELKPPSGSAEGRLRYTDKFEDPGMPDEMQVTVTLRPVLDGGATELTILQENLPPQIPAEMCYLGWQESVNQLTQLVEPEIHDDPVSK